MRLLRPLLTLLAFVAAWKLLVLAGGIQPFLLPPPERVLRTLVERRAVLLDNALVTLAEIVLGIAAGALAGIAAAILLAASPRARRWLLPVLVGSQALPVFAVAPLLVLWLGYGLASKVAMAVLVIFFPVTTAFLDGLRRTDQGWLDLATVMGASPARQMLAIRVPAALPALVSGLRVAAAIAPIGAVIGEWVGASRGLGYLMLQANARMQVDTVFAALILLTATALALWALVDLLARRLVSWQPETLPQP